MVIEECVELDPADAAAPRRASDGRSMWLAPMSRHITSERILAEEEFVLSWAMEAQNEEPMPSTTVDVEGLDVMQARLPSRRRRRPTRPRRRAGRSRQDDHAARRRSTDLDRQPVGVRSRTVGEGRPCPRTRDRMPADTLAKLLHEWERADRPRSTATASRPARR